MARKPTLESNAAALKRWRTRFSRAVRMVQKLEQQQKRLMAATIKRDLATVYRPPASPICSIAKSDPEREAAAPKMESAPDPKQVGERIEQKVDHDLDIPSFLKRGQAAQKAVDEIIADQIKAEQAETRKKKAAGRIAKMKAKKAGDLKKMPLTGKAALDIIRNG